MTVDDIMGVLAKYVDGDADAAKLLADMCLEHGDDDTADALRAGRHVLRFNREGAAGRVTMHRGTYGADVYIDEHDATGDVTRGRDYDAAIDLYGPAVLRDHGFKPGHVLLLVHDRDKDVAACIVRYTSGGHVVNLTVDGDMQYRRGPHAQLDDEHYFTYPAVAEDTPAE